MPSYATKPQFDAAAPQDGRRARSVQSRRRIVQAMLELVSEGAVSPSAEAVAERAGVGLRSVFRHFNDMDSLYREMSAAIETGLTNVVAKPLADSDWRGQLDEIMDRRATAFEALGPYIRAAQANRHRSPALDLDYRRLSGMSRDNLKRVLDLGGRSSLLDALDLILSFEAWTRLRQDQSLSDVQTRAVVRTMVAAMTEA